MSLFLALLLAAAPVPPTAETVRTIATVAIADNARVAAADLVAVPGGRLFVRTRNAAGMKVGGTELASVRSVLAVLADRRLAPFWPAVAEFAGPDLVRHRDRLLERTAEGVRLGISPLSPANMRQLALADSRAQAARQRFEAMVEAGRLDAGLAEAGEAIARAAADKSNDAPNGEFGLRIAAAGALASNDRVDEALAMLEAGERSAHTYKEFRRNYWINRAALLVEAGRYAEGLRWADAAVASARTGPAYADVYVHFAWIRGCALQGLGRAAEAAAQYLIVDAATAPELAQARLRALACLADDDRFAAELIRQLQTGDVPSEVAVMLRSVQLTPGRWRPVWRRAASRPDVRAALDARARPLPPELTPALRNWTD
jgi:hypothetical protein